jgi:hypothetical protein
MKLIPSMYIKSFIFQMWEIVFSEENELSSKNILGIE